MSVHNRWTDFVGSGWACDNSVENMLDLTRIEAAMRGQKSPDGAWLQTRIDGVEKGRLSNLEIPLEPGALIVSHHSADSCRTVLPSRKSLDGRSGPRVLVTVPSPQGGLLGLRFTVTMARSANTQTSLRESKVTTS